MWAVRPVRKLEPRLSKHNIAGSKTGSGTQAFCLKVQSSCHFANKEMSMELLLLFIQKHLESDHLPSLQKKIPLWRASQCVCVRKTEGSLFKN